MVVSDQDAGERRAREGLGNRVDMRLDATPASTSAGSSPSRSHVLFPDGPVHSDGLPAGTSSGSVTVPARRRGSTRSWRTASESEPLGVVVVHHLHRSSARHRPLLRVDDLVFVPEARSTELRDPKADVERLAVLAGTLVVAFARARITPGIPGGNCGVPKPQSERQWAKRACSR